MTQQFWAEAVAETWRRVWGEDGIFFRGPKILNDFFGGKNFHFRGKNF